MRNCLDEVVVEIRRVLHVRIEIDNRLLKVGTRLTVGDGGGSHFAQLQPPSGCY